MTRARRLSDPSDIIIAIPIIAVQPAVGFTLPAKDRRTLGRPKQQPCVTRLDSPTRETRAILTKNRFEVLSDREPAEITIRVGKSPTATRKVNVETAPPVHSTRIRVRPLSQTTCDRERNGNNGCTETVPPVSAGFRTRHTGHVSRGLHIKGPPQKKTLKKYLGCMSYYLSFFVSYVIISFF